MNEMAKYLSFTYKFKSLMDNVIPEIVDDLNKDYAIIKSNDISPFQVGDASFTDNNYLIEKVFQGYYIKYNESKQKKGENYLKGIYVGLNLNLVSEFMCLDDAEKPEDCIMGVDIARIYSRKEGAKLSTEENDDKEWRYYYHNIDLERCLKNQLLDKTAFKKAVVKIIKDNHIAFAD